MYEQFKNDMLAQMVKDAKFTPEQIEPILKYLDVVMNNYEISKKELGITVYNQELPNLVKMFLVCKKIEGFSDGTLYNYTRHLSNFFLMVQKQPEQVVANDIRVYLYNYQQARGITNRSLDKVRSCLASFFNWATNEGYVEKNPMASVNKIKYEKTPKQPCSQIDLEYLRMACKTPKQKAILEVLYSTGCRVGELVILKKEDIDWREKTVHLFGKGQKHRTSFINAKAEVALKEYLDSREDDNEWLFVSDRKPHNQMHVSGIQKIIREMANRAGDKINKKITPHVLRHTFCTTAIEHGANIASVQKMAGHSNLNTTSQYIHISLDSAKADHSKSVI